MVPLRWQRATPTERQYLRAMLKTTTSIINRPSGLKTFRAASQLTVARSSLISKSLISKSLIYAPDHGAVRFTVQGMSAFISRQFEA